MNSLLEAIGDVTMLAGALLFFLGAAGVLRLPDLYSRLSGVTISGASGTGLVLVGLFLNFPSLENALKLGLAITIQLATTAVGGTAMARAAYLTGAPQSTLTRFDDLAVEEREIEPGEDHPGYSRPDT